jgi:hypothetical protein
MNTCLPKSSSIKHPPNHRSKPNPTLSLVKKIGLVFLITCLLSRAVAAQDDPPCEPTLFTSLAVRGALTTESFADTYGYGYGIALLQNAKLTKKLFFVSEQGVMRHGVNQSLTTRSDTASKGLNVFYSLFGLKAYPNFGARFSPANSFFVSADFIQFINSESFRDGAPNRTRVEIGYGVGIGWSSRGLEWVIQYLLGNQSQVSLRFAFQIF